MRSASRVVVHGFTLIELMVTLAVVAVLAGIAGPQLLPFIQNSRLNAAANLIQADLQLARREAIKRNVPVRICPIGSSALACGSVWTTGWMVCYLKGPAFDDCDDTGGSANPNPIVTRGAAESTTVLTSFPTSAPFIRFNSNGSHGTPPGTALSFTVKGSWSGTKVYTFTIPATGNVTMKAT